MSDFILKGYTQSYGLSFIMLSREWERRVENSLLNYNLSLRELIILKCLQRHNSIKQKDLSLVIGDPQRKISHCLSLLQEKALVGRECERGKGHAQCFYLTLSGRKTLCEATSMLSKHDEYFLGHLPRATREGIGQTLENVLVKKGLQ
ncbi:hypothetical protein MUA04_21440 [Enterobacteriaceae bacterium H11S18]|uniref:hypothetical protein n=1 Tax=Dryocola clanedunensis TaxID=2925396 RepID=UPI0022F0C62F|nr:hypothetical protein [Dryocola clanedunensis]MCT4712734.1 hypothetical protein [Dryocola clanedunensis]